MWFLILLSIGLTEYASSTLQGDHICPTEEKYMVNVTQMVLRKVKIRRYKWCMNVPPRCSFYTDEEQYVPETVEEEVKKIANKCCPGFVENINKIKCIPQCDGCLHGVCDKNTNKCICHAGFKGDKCDIECQSGSWGRNCEFICSCSKGDCDPITGYCICPPGWKGNRCQEKIVDLTTMTTTDTESTTTTIFKTTTTNSYGNMEQRLSKIFNRTKHPALQKYYTFYITTQNPKLTTTRKKIKSKSNHLNDLEIWQPPRTYSVTEKNSSAVIHIPSLTNAKISNITWLSNNENSPTTEKTSYRKEELTTGQTTEMDTLPVPVTHMTSSSSNEDNAKQEKDFVNREITDHVVSVTQPSHANLKAKVVDELEVSVTSTQVFSKQEEWLGDESRVALKNHLTIHQNQAPIHNSHLVFSIGAAVGTIATLIAIIAAVVTTRNYRRKKYSDDEDIKTNQNKNENGDACIPAVSIYTRSVFHTPLPEPPVFENPIFTTPLECDINKTDFSGTVETQVFCTFRKDSRIVDTFYDHPPSTGSYRAASIPEPPEQNSEISKTESREHLYDEIPCWKQPLAITDGTDVTLVSNNNETQCFYANTVSDSNNLVLMQKTHM